MNRLYFKNIKNKILLLNYLIIFLFSLLSFINCFDVVTWFLEVIPVYIGLFILFYLYKKNIEISNLLHFFISIQMIIVIIGGHYSYARVPIFDELSIWFNWSRNNYDKLGHFVQGITPFLIMREILIKKNILKNGFLLIFICISTSLAVSAVYEIIEFTAAIILNSGADEFLGTQGDVWDTQKDILYALLGSIFASSVTFWKKNN